VGAVEFVGILELVRVVVVNADLASPQDNIVLADRRI